MCPGIGKLFDMAVNGTTELSIRSETLSNNSRLTGPPGDYFG